MQGAAVGKGDKDPLEGKWSLQDATKDLKGKGALLAKIETSKGTLSCKLLEDKAPGTVANFVGLAQGTRPWKAPSGEDVSIYRVRGGGPRVHGRAATRR
jgi:peptidyl-prolyl cis-trans isomerase A (cyclophilin A)